MFIAEPKQISEAISAYIEQCNQIKNGIKSATNQSEIMNVYKAINKLEGEHGETMDVVMFRKNLSEKLSELRTNVEAEKERLNKQEQAIRREVFTDSASDIEQVNARANQIYMRLSMQMTHDKIKNSMVIANALKTGDRATGIALMNLALTDSYAPYFSPRQKEQALVMSKPGAEKKWEERRDNRLKVIGEKHAQATMEAFRLKNTETVINKKKGYYFQ